MVDKLNSRRIPGDYRDLPLGCGDLLPAAVGWFITLSKPDALQERFNGSVSDKVCGKSDGQGSYIICDRCVKKAGLLW